MTERAIFVGVIVVMAVLLLSRRKSSNISPSLKKAALLVQSALDKLDASIPDKL